MTRVRTANQSAPASGEVTYVSRRTGGAPVRRSSLWRRTGGTWRLYCQQGTVAAGNS
ncbi:hypothetical protein ACFWUU_06355 [Kribbella sp. NPDC058693]|uniref:hypothetical protein n=1 Tax=Kribbella sp. NPDC058693 TaxID=3346602 RepID=UPI0036525BAC